MTGKTNNPAGRPAGKPNKFTRDIRNILKQVISDEIDLLPETLKTLTAKERIDVLCKLIGYICPKVEPVHMKESEPLSFNG